MAILYLFIKIVVVAVAVDNDVAKFHKKLKPLQKRDETNKLGYLSLS